MDDVRSGWPAQFTFAPLAKFDPLIVRVNREPPTAAELGTRPGGTAVRLLMVGAGLLTAATDAAVPPPRLAGKLAVIVANPGDTPVTLNVAEVLGAVMVTDDGTVATPGAVEPREIAVSAAGAAPSVTCRALVAPTSTDGLAGVRVSEALLTEKGKPFD